MFRNRVPQWLPTFLLGLVLAPAAFGQQPSVLEGTVTDQADDPVRDVSVLITRADEPDFTVRATTNKRGRFNARLASGGGTYTVQLEAEGFDTYEGPVEIQDGTGHELTYKLAPKGTGRQQEAAKLFEEGTVAYQAQNAELAKEKFLGVLAANPDLFQPHVYLADLYMREGELDKAVESIEIYLPNDAKNVTVQRLAFEIYRAQGNEEGMGRMIDALQGTEIAEGLAAKIYNEGVEKSRGEDVEAALADFRLALRLAPGLDAVYSGMSALLLNEGSFAEAAAAADKLLAAKPNDPRGLRIRYLALAGAKDPGADAALKAWAAGAGDDATDYLYAKAEEAFKADRHAEAIALAKQVLAVDADHAEAHFTLGLTYTASGDPAQAKKHLQRFLELAPNHAEAGTARELVKGL